MRTKLARILKNLTRILVIDAFDANPPMEGLCLSSSTNVVREHFLHAFSFTHAIIMSSGILKTT